MTIDSSPIFEVEPDVYLSTKSAVRSEYIMDFVDVESVVTLTTNTVDVTTDHHPLVDGLNYQSNFNQSVDATRQALQSNRGVIVHCRAGVSRSPTVLATALAAERDKTFDEMISYISKSRPAASPRLPLRWHASEYLGAGSIVEKIKNSQFSVDPETVLNNNGSGTPIKGGLSIDLPDGLDESFERS